MTAYAVIGAFYGDEGKGLTTDYLADKLGGKNVVVVRSNGGAQAAHTVQLPDGRRHVFHHFGSGTFTGARTHLSKFMICNPITFNEEWDDLVEMGFTPDVTVSPLALVTTPFDMLINQAVEVKRGRGVHGSCGLGINETVERSHGDHRITVADLFYSDEALKNKLVAIRDEWVENRWLDLLAKTKPFRTMAEWEWPDGFKELVRDRTLIDRWLDQVELFKRRIYKLDDQLLLRDAEHIIFEGAQGLLLDERYGEMPYCTRSNTGLENIGHICSLLDIKEIITHYVMRCYTTRHGAGPLLDEAMDPMELGLEFDDPTNVHNQWQGTIRTAPLNFQNLKGVGEDLKRAKTMYPDLTITPVVVMTCLDQFRSDKPLTVKGVRTDTRGDPVLALPLEISTQFGTPSLAMLTSWGPSRETVKQHVLESFATNSEEQTLRLLKLANLESIPTLCLAYTTEEIKKLNTYVNWVTCLFSDEEGRQLIRLAAPNELTKRVAAL